MLPKRFPTYKLSSGRELYRRICRFCLRADARLKERAKLEMDRIQPATLDPEISASRIVEPGDQATFSFQQWNPMKEPAISQPDGR
jgi:hypothetical protein